MRLRYSFGVNYDFLKHLVNRIHDSNGSSCFRFALFIHNFDRAEGIVRPTESIVRPTESIVRPTESIVRPTDLSHIF
jgi:hypothetical protein